MSLPDRRAMIDVARDDLSVRRQCELLALARSGVYRPQSATAARDLALMRRLDDLHLKLPFYGSRRMLFELNKEGHGVNRKHVQRLMRVMGIAALVPRPGTSKPAPGHKIYPYLLRGVAISMDGRGRFLDNIFIERLWRSLKYEEVHLKAYADGREARADIGAWMAFYNNERPHQAMDYQMPMAVWHASMARIEAAATTEMAERAVDMPLRLDNANALPTYPQQQKKQQAAA